MTTASPVWTEREMDRVDVKDMTSYRDTRQTGRKVEGGTDRQAGKWREEQTDRP